MPQGEGETVALFRSRVARPIRDWSTGPIVKQSNLPDFRLEMMITGLTYFGAGGTAMNTGSLSSWSSSIPTWSG